MHLNLHKQCEHEIKECVCVCGEQKLQDMDERRIRRLAEGYCQFSDVEKKVLPIISKCLEGVSAAGARINEKQVNVCFVLSL